MSGEFKKTVSMLALLAAAGIMVGGVAPKAARAADLGGDCCADLEERVAELEATSIKKGNKKVSLTITGRVNANIMAWSENGPGASTTANSVYDHTSDVYFGNVARNDSRIELKGEGKVNGDLTAGFYMEIRSDFSLSPNPTQIVHQEAWSPAARATYVFLSSKSLGELRLGNQDASIDDTFTKTDLAVDVVGKHSQATRAALGFNLRDIKGKFGPSYRAILQPIEDSKANRFTYISPTFQGFTFKSDVGGDDLWSTALNYKDEFQTVKLAGSVGYQEAGGVDGGSNTIVGTSPAVAVSQRIQFSKSGDGQVDLVDNNRTERMFAVAGSIWELNSGLFLTGEYSRAYANTVNGGRKDVTEWFAKVGWQKNVTAIGMTAIYASWEQQDNLFKNDTSGHILAAGINQELDEAAANVYLHYQRASLDTATTNAAGVVIPTQSIDQVIGGMIIKF